MKNEPIVIMYEQNDAQHQQQIKNVNSKAYKNTKKNADLNNKCGKEHLERAKKAREDGSKQVMDEQTKLAAKDLIDGAEKYIKSNAIINGEEYNKYKGKSSREEPVLKSHCFDVMRQAPSNSRILSEDDAKKLDKYADPEQGFYSSHTALSYGDVQPKLDDVEEINKITSKLKEHVEKEEQEITEKERTKAIASQIDKSMTS